MQSVSLLKALQENGVDIGTYHGGCIVGNQCMATAKKGNNVIQTMMKAMLPKIKDADNRKYLKDTCDQMKHMLNLWYELQRTMKSVEYQNDLNCARFKENTTRMNKAIHSLITHPLFPGVN